MNRRRKSAHAGTPEPSRKAEPKPLKYHRRLRVKAEPDVGDEFPMVREVFLEAAITPQGAWYVELMHTNLPVLRAVDLIRWAREAELPVVYDPPGNMGGYFRGRDCDRRPTLFDVGTLE